MNQSAANIPCSTRYQNRTRRWLGMRRQINAIECICFQGTFSIRNCLSYVHIDQKLDEITPH